MPYRAVVTSAGAARGRRVLGRPLTPAPALLPRLNTDVIAHVLYRSAVLWAEILTYVALILEAAAGATFVTPVS